MSYKKGEHIVYIVDDSSKYPYTIEKLYMGKTYVFEKYSTLNKNQLVIKEYPYMLFNTNTFISLIDYRKQKIDKIKNRPR